MPNDARPYEGPHPAPRDKQSRRQSAVEKRRRDDVLRAVKPDARFLAQLLAADSRHADPHETKTAPGSGAAAYHSTMSSESRLFGPADHLDRAT